MQPANAPPVTSRADTLALVYQNILTGVVRIQSGRQALLEVETFRRRMKAALQECEREAGVSGYASADVRDASFAVIAFLDETILSSKDPKADEWRKRPLNIELFGQAVAGDVFYDKLLDIERRRDSSEVADLLEVYLLCLLLGFEGRFAPPLRGEASRIAERLRRRIESIRGLDYKLSPPIQFLPEAPKLNAETGMWRWWILGCVVGAILLFLLFRWNLSFRLDELRMAVVSLN
jgi:type VI secretion system protein ImpK